MKKTKIQNGLTPNQERLQSILEYKKYKTIKRKELLGIILKYKISRNPEYLIKSMLQKKRLISLKRGDYIIIPISSINKSIGLNNFEIVEHLLKHNYYFGLYNAFNFHGFTEQIPNKLFIFNTKYSADKMIFNYKFKFFKVNKDKIFGMTKGKFPYSDKERTIIDVLDYPGYLGGLSEIIERIKSQEYNKIKLVDYAIRYKSIKVMKLVGLLTNSSKLATFLDKKNAFSYYTTIKKSGIKLLDKKWKIRLI